MFKKFYLSLNESFFVNKYKELYRSNSNYDSLNKKVGEYLFEHVLSSGVLEGKKIENDWFPQINADVFVSHSHCDLNIAKGLAYWLYDKFKLTAFVDSCVWGHVDYLIGKLKKAQADIPNLESHLHALLTISLHKMIDKAECIFFINTPNSSVVNGGGKSGTYSPWIYSEISLANLTRTTSPVRYKRHISEAMESNKIIHEPDYSSFIPIESSVLSDWVQKSNGIVNHLDCLYGLVGLIS